MTESRAIAWPLPKIAAACTTRLDRAAGVGGGRVRPAGRRLLVLPGRPARQVQGDGREQPPAHADRCARRAASSSTAPAELLVENRNSFNISIVREHTKDLDRTIRVLAQVTGVDEKRVREIVDRHRREPSYRPIVVVQDATLAQVAAVTARRLDFELPDVIVQEVPTRQYPDQAHGRAPDRLRRRGQRRADGRRQRADRHRSSASRRRARLQQAADGRGRRAPRRRQQRRPRNPHARRGAAGRGPPRAADDQLRDAAGGRGGVPRLRLLGLGGRARAEDRRRAHARRACRPTIPTPSPPASIARRGTRSTPTSCGRCRTAPSRAATRRARPSRSWSRRRRSKKASITPERQIFCPGGGDVLRPLLQVPPGGRPRLRRPAARHREVVQHLLLHASATCSASTGSTSGPRSSGLAGKSGIDLPNEVESIVPSTEWKQQRTGEKWYAGETISVAIGQGQVSVTPMSMAVMMATVANGGTRVVPRLVKAVRRGQGLAAGAGAAAAVRAVPAEAGDRLGACTTACGWRSTAPAPAGARAIAGRDVAGKTGTAQVISHPGQGAGARQRQGPARPRLVRVHGAEGQPGDGRRDLRRARRARLPDGAPIARHIIETYYAQKDGQPLPVLTRRRPRPTPRRRRPAPRRPPTVARRRRSGADMFERRLYLPHRLAAARRRAARSARSAWR